MRIGIVAREDRNEENKPFDEFWYLDRYFVDIFNELKVNLIPIVSDILLDEIVDICDGLVLIGSANDINPKYYNQELMEGKSLKYDEYPFVEKVVKAFDEVNKPILGICAGLQEINVIFGGSLYQKIDGHNLRDESMHNIDIESDTFLNKIYKTDRLEVNSYHLQAIKDLAYGFKVSAKADDGIIEGIENDNVYAVQWHPEVVMDKKIFEYFIEECKNRR